MTDYMLESVWNGRESSTVRKYCLSLRGFIAYGVKNGFDNSLPLSSTDAAEYLTHLRLSKGTKGAINTALAALKWVHSFIPGINRNNNPMDDGFYLKSRATPVGIYRRKKFKKKPIFRGHG